MEKKVKTAIFSEIESKRQNNNAVARGITSTIQDSGDDRRTTFRGPKSDQL